CEELRIARREMNLVIAKNLASLPIEDEQRIEPSSASKCRRANQHVAPVRSRGLGNGLPSILNFAAREFPEVHVVSREGAFGKQHSITAEPRGPGDKSANDFDILWQSPAKLQLGRRDLENFCRH